MRRLRALEVRRTALLVIICTILLDLLAAVFYARLSHIPLLPSRRGLYCGLGWAIGVMFTTGDVGPNPVLRDQWWLWITVHSSVIPLAGASISVFTTSLTAGHVRAAKEEITGHVHAAKAEIKDHIELHSGTTGGD